MFWNNFVALCAEKGVSPNAVTKEIGLSTATATNWKRGAQPRDTALLKVADYFGVSVQTLLSDEPVNKSSSMLNVHKTIQLIEANNFKIGGFCTDKLGVPRQYFPELLRGKRKIENVPDELIFTIAKELGTSYEYLTDITDDPAPNFIGRLAESTQERLKREVIDKISSMNPDELETLDKLLHLSPEKREYLAKAVED